MKADRVLLATRHKAPLDSCGRLAQPTALSVVSWGYGQVCRNAVLCQDFSALRSGRGWTVSSAGGCGKQAVRHGRGVARPCIFRQRAPLLSEWEPGFIPSVTENTVLCSWFRF